MPFQVAFEGKLRVTEAQFFPFFGTTDQKYWIYRINSNYQYSWNTPKWLSPHPPLLYLDLLEVSYEQLS